MAFGVMASRDLVDNIRLDLDTGEGYKRINKERSLLNPGITKLNGKVFLTNSGHNVAIYLNGIFANAFFDMQKVNNLVTFQYKSILDLSKYQQKILFEVRIIL